MSHEPELARVAADLRALERARAAGELDQAGHERRRCAIDELLKLFARGSSTERRKHVRIPADLEVHIRIDGVEAAACCAASELSQGGLGLRGELWVEEGATVLVENLRVGTRDYPMAVRARLVWKSVGGEHPGAGLTFLDVDAEGERQIRSIFEQLFWLYVERLAEG